MGTRAADDDGTQGQEQQRYFLSARIVPEWDEIELQERISEIESETRALVPRIQRSCESGQGTGTAVEDEASRGPVLVEVERKEEENEMDTMWSNLKECLVKQEDEAVHSYAYNLDEKRYTQNMQNITDCVDSWFKEGESSSSREEKLWSTTAMADVPLLLEMDDLEQHGCLPSGLGKFSPMELLDYLGLERVHIARPMLSFLPKGASVDVHGGHMGGGRWIQVVKGELLVALIPPLESNILSYQSNIYNKSGTVLADTLLTGLLGVKVLQEECLIVPPGWLCALVASARSVLLSGVFLRMDSLDKMLKTFKALSHDAPVSDFVEGFGKKLFWHCGRVYGNRLASKLHLYGNYLGQNVSSRIEELNGQLESLSQGRQIVLGEHEFKLSNPSTGKMASTQAEDKSEPDMPANKSIDFPSNRLRIKVRRPSEDYHNNIPSSPKRIKLRVEKDHSVKSVDSLLTSLDLSPMLTLPENSERAKECLTYLYWTLRDWKFSDTGLDMYAAGFNIAKTFVILEAALEAAAIIPSLGMSTIRDCGSTMFSREMSGLNAEYGALPPPTEVPIEECGETPDASMAQCHCLEWPVDGTPIHATRLVESTSIRSPKISPGRKPKHSTAKKRLAKKLGIPVS
jgi:hypothetical protein